MTRRGPLPAPLLVLASIVSVQFGGAVAATLIPVVGSVGAVAGRIVISGVVLMLAARPRWRGRSTRDWQVVITYGATLSLMNLSFYEALRHLPIGVAVTIEFVGPLVLAASLSRTVRDTVAVVAAGLGVVLVSGALSTAWSKLPVLGILLALTAGTLWAVYIITSGWTGARFAELDGLAFALFFGALVLGPAAALTTDLHDWSGGTIAKAVAMAMLSSLLPYSLELVALRSMAARVFGVLLSLEPAVAALAGLMVLGQRLGGTQLVGMALVVLASLVVMTHRSPADSEPTTPAETG